ncbi:MAG: hypothetical protein AWM53_01408 [Candidatus Dichloromethanomonas elyunquensis]|nr:MAG: hypothetical protein AWM53_01408 [Candidatus Dichloromethanomonas elyunquensis]
MITELLFIPVGVIIGALAGFYGVGGAIVLVPTLLIVGFNPSGVVPTTLMFSFGMSISGTIVHTKMKNVNWKIALIIGLVGALSAQVSKGVVIYISGKYDWIFSLLFIVLLCYFAFSFYRSKYKESTPNEIRNPYFVSITIGLVIGFLSSLLGIGGGFITIPLLINWLGFDSKKAIGTSLAGIIIISLGGIIGYSTRIHLNYLLGLCLIAGAFIGSPFGARMTTKYKSSEMTQRLGTLYIFVILSTVMELIASFTLPYLKYLSLFILMLLLVHMLFDFYKHRGVQIENT